METALRHLEQQEDTSPDDLLLLRRLRNIATKKRGTAIQQRTVSPRNNIYKTGAIIKKVM
jgi:hypothetical protein